MCRLWELHVPDLVKHQSMCATHISYTGETVGHNLDIDVREVRCGLIWQCAGRPVGRAKVSARSELIGRENPCLVRCFT